MRQTIDVCVLSIKLESGAFTKKKIVVLLGISGGSFFSPLPTLFMLS